MKNQPVVPFVYFHTENGGIAFKVFDDEGPVLQIEATHFENTLNSMVLKLDRVALRALGNMLTQAAECKKYDEVGHRTISAMRNKVVVYPVEP